MKLETKKVNHPITENTCPFCGEVHETKCLGTYCHLGSNSEKIENLRREMHCETCGKDWQTWYKCQFDYLSEEIQENGRLRVIKLVRHEVNK